MWTKLSENKSPISEFAYASFEQKVRYVIQFGNEPDLKISGGEALQKIWPIVTKKVNSRKIGLHDWTSSKLATWLALGNFLKTNLNSKQFDQLFRPFT